MLIKTFCPEIHIVINSKCCAGTTSENHKYALKTINSCQIEVI
ncbi:hypothetical protein [Thomasclavelia cocleata]